MPFATNGDVELFYEEIGPADRPAVLLLTGTGRQSIDFGDAFCRPLLAAGYRLIRFDARDTGLSSGLSDRPSNLAAVFDAVTEGREPPLAYDLDDMAADALAVLSAVGETAVHMVGRSLGAAIAQRLAIAHPGLVRSLSLVMCFSRGPIETVTRERMAALEAEVISDEDEFVTRQVRGAMSTGSPLYFDDKRVEAEARAAFARGFHAGGIARHFAVGISAPDLRPQLADYHGPVLAIHGRLDAVIPLRFAEETAAAAPMGRLEVLDDMAHDGPPELQARWAELVVEHLARAERR